MRKINPALQAYLDAQKSGLYTDQELDDLLKSLDLKAEDLLPTVEVRDIRGTKPVTTLKTINDEEMAIEAALPNLGPLQTDKQHRANEATRKQIEEMAKNRGSEKKA